MTRMLFLQSRERFLKLLNYQIAQLPNSFDSCLSAKFAATPFTPAAPSPSACIMTPVPTCAGEMAEWLKAHAWKACLGETLTWVRIPLSPPDFLFRYAGLCAGFSTKLPDRVMDSCATFQVESEAG